MQDHWSKVHQDMRAIYEDISAPERDEKSAATSSGTEEQSKVRIREAIYKIRTLAKKQGKPLSRAYQEYIANSSLSPAEKAKVKAKVMGTSEEYIYHMESLQFDEQTGQYKVRVTESNSGKMFVRTISLQKVHELRSMPDSYNFATEAKKLDPVGQEDGDVDNDGDEDEYDEYLKKRRKAVGKAIENQKEDLEVHEDLMKETLDKMDEAMRPGDRQRKMAAKRHDPYATSRDRATAHNVAVRNDGPGTPGYEKKSTGGKGARYAGYGDQGAGNKARRRAGQEPLRGNTRREEVEPVNEIIDPKGAARMDAAKKKNKVDVFAYDRKLQAQGKLKGKKLPPPPTNESAVPGKPAEKLSAVTSIPQSERDAAKKRLLAKAAAKRSGMKREEVEIDEASYEAAAAKVNAERAAKKAAQDKRLTVTNADKKGNTPAYQRYMAGDKKYKMVGENSELEEKAPETDKKGLDKFDRHKRMTRHMQDKYGRASVMDKVRTGKDYKENVETPFGNMKAMVARAIKRIDANVDGSVDEKDLKNPNEMGEFVPTPDGKKKTTRVKESYSWRNELIEVMGDKLDDDSKKKIDVMKGKNVVNLNPKEEVDLSDSLEVVVEEEKCEKKYCRLCKKKETKSQCGFGPKMWEKYSVDDASETEVENAADESGISDGGVSEETGAEYHARMKKKTMPWEKPNTTVSNTTPEVKAKIAARKSASKPEKKKDTRTDAQKMTDATGPRPGSRYRGD